MRKQIPIHAKLIQLLVLTLSICFIGISLVAQEPYLKSDAKLLEDLSKEKLYGSAITHSPPIPPNARRAYVVYTNPSQQVAFNELLGNLPELEELQIGIRAFGALSFDFLKELPNLKILTISSAVPGEGIINDTWGDVIPLDLSFLKKFPELRILSLRWEGVIINADAVLSLSKLIHLGIPNISFNPIFVQSKSLQLIELGEGETLLLSKNPSWSQALEWPLPGSDRMHVELFAAEDTVYANFLKQMKLNSKSPRNDWIFPITKTDSLGDTLFFLSDVTKEFVQWKMKLYEQSHLFSGSMTQNKGSSIKFYSKFEMVASNIGREVFQDGQRTKIIQPRSESNGSIELTSIEETNYLNDLPDGLSIIYYPDKTIKKQQLFELGKPVGTPLEYDDKGNIIKR